jgi:hypothetical protein
MLSQFAARSVRLGQVFADPLQIEVPPYQRSYVWTAPRPAGLLLDDITLAMECGRWRRTLIISLGTMLLIDSDQAALLRDGWPLTGAARKFEVVDGLQRLTTLTILFCVLRDLDRGGARHRICRAGGCHPGGHGGARSRGCRCAGTDEKFFQAYVRAGRGLPHHAGQRPAVRRRGAHAGGARALPDRRCWISMLRSGGGLPSSCWSTAPWCWWLPSGIDRAHRMFMVLNETGKPLARNDILKAELLGSIPAVLPGPPAPRGNPSKARLGGEFESLFSHIRTMYGRSSAQVIAGVRAGGRRVRWRGGLHRQGAGRRPRPSWTTCAMRATPGSVHSAAIAARCHTCRGCRPRTGCRRRCCGGSQEGKDPAELAWFLQGLDRLAYGLRILGLGPAGAQKRFGTIISAIRNGNDSRPPAARSTCCATRSAISNTALRDLHVRSAPLLQAWCWYASTTRWRAGRRTCRIGELTVEHVLPRKHGTGSAWRGAFPDAQEREQCTEALGNLVLVSKAQNDKAGNLEFAAQASRSTSRRRGDRRSPSTSTCAGRRRGRPRRSGSATRADEALHALWGFGGDGRRARPSAGSGLEGPPAR